MTNEALNTEIAKVKATGCKLSDEKIKAIILKKEASTAKRDKRSSKSWAKRDNAKEALKTPSIYGDMTMSEINKANAMKNLPSSMR